ncbi:MAG: BREX-1 system adenine-specific DNA-methyltransferase PglX [Actinobacteria bacterium]|nr:BREX-1 system adenine-specific DNA-methyltransferase PglX [Cyanobacteriota bacterium]MCL5772258.1 BREX-1 system adenine-specific DNA-methyltransferase PglX [Actinomycetota bacterium]
MEKTQAKDIIKNIFENKFDKAKFTNFIINLLNINSKELIKETNVDFGRNYIPEIFNQHIDSFQLIGKYEFDKQLIDILVVNLKKETSLDRARTMQRNFIAWYLKNNSDINLKDAALVAFVSPDSSNWRFSLIKMDYDYKQEETGKVKIKEEFTPARRWSFLVGESENSHTAQSQLVELLADESNKPTLKNLEDAFNIEKVTKEFFKKYAELFNNLKDVLEEIIKSDQKVKSDFETKSINSVDFSKKLLGQIVFLYFLQKKGWFGVKRDDNWGKGPKDFLRRLFDKEYIQYNNFFNDVLEPLFYEALRIDRSYDDDYLSMFKCKIPFLNGGLFDPINNYDWVHTDILLPNELFSNKNQTKEGDIGDGILNVFDRYNFTVKEDEPLEKEVAVDPEMLGKVFENLLEVKDRKSKGTYYTPREIVHYMCQQSLINYLATEMENILSKDEIENFVKYCEQVDGNEISTSPENNVISQNIISNAKLMDDKLADIKVCDPAVGSGAFLVGMMSEIVRARIALNIFLKDKTKTAYNLKRECIENSLYGVDIDPGAVEIAKLRLWLSLIVDEEDIKQIKPLPNLDYKIVCGDSLKYININTSNVSFINDLEKIKKLLFNEINPTKKTQIKNEVESLIFRISKGNKEFDFQIYFSEIFHQNNGFDIVIANPPYMSNKGIDKKILSEYEKIYKISDDLYNYFFQKAFLILKYKGIIAFISSDTYLTIQSKINLRKLFQENQIIELIKTENVFEEPLVEPAIIIIKKEVTINKNYDFVFKDAKDSFLKPISYKTDISIYRNSSNKVFFPPTQLNMQIYEKYNKEICKLMNKWWNYISTSKNISKYKDILDEYRTNLKPGDITLLGLITEGGQGLATANNGKFIGVIETSKEAENIKNSRGKKFFEAIYNNKIVEFNQIKSIQDASKYLNNLSEDQIVYLFDNLKQKYGRDIFGQGYIYRIIREDQIADIDKLSDDEKKYGICSNKPHFVLYDKGDKEGNRWYLESPFYIDWVKENVEKLKSEPKARWQGYQFFFREGFCWTDVNSIYLKARLKSKSIHDVLSMSLFSKDKRVPNLFCVCLINSKFISEYVENFLNNTSHFQINDARQLPIIIPDKEQLKTFEQIFNKAFQVKKDQFNQHTSKKEADEELSLIQKELDEKVYELYNLK